MKSVVLDLIGSHFLDKAVSLLKRNATLRGTGDNWDIRILVGQMRSFNQNKDLHLFASNIIVNRVDFRHLPNDKPKNNIKDLPRSKFSLNIDEWKKYISTSKVIIGRIFIEFFKEFKFLEKCLPVHIKHKYSKEMSQKSTIISMPIINVNESSYNDCVHILRTYESWIGEIYQNAGLLPDIPAKDDPNIPMGAANKSQLYSHRNHTPGDIMKDMKICFAGDQLTRVRFAGAKDIMAASSTPIDRLEHCSPFKGAMFHTLASFVQYNYHLLFDAESVNQIGTLKYFREKYNRKNCTPSKVLDSYEGSEELLINMGKAYIVVAALDFFGMKNLDDKPTIHAFPPNLVHKSVEEKRIYFDEVLQEFIDKYILQKGVNDADDHVKNYALCSIFLTLLVLQMKDTAKEADGERNLINQKLLLTIFKSLGAYSKYAIEMFISIAQVESLLTPQLAEQFKWSYFVNWKGGEGNNMEEDKAQEITNKLSKNMVQRMGPNKTINSISKICKATTGIKESIENIDTELGIHKTSTKHTKQESKADEIEMIREIQLLKPFTYTPGRYHASFPDIKRSPMLYLNIVEFHKWLDRHKSEVTLVV